MEWVDGCSLETLLSQGSISRPLARKIFCEICEALGYMHRKQVVHRDLKPHNILMTYNGQNVKIIDFGLSDTDSYYVFKAPAGTRFYASPELLTGGQVDGRSDIWSLGIILNEMGVFSHVASGCLRRNKERRFSCAEDVSKAVLHSGRRRYLLWSLCLVCILLAAFAGLWIYERGVFDDDELHDEYPIPEVADTLHSTRPESEIPVVPKKEESTPSSDDIDSEMLDDLFLEAVKKIN